MCYAVQRGVDAATGMRLNKLAGVVILTSAAPADASDREAFR
jgi:hypothetical protein